MKQAFPIIVVVILAAAIPVCSEAQESPYVGLGQRPIKALSPEDVAGYAEGAGMALALPAELNGYPGPRHVLDNADAMGLSQGQRDAISAIFDSMHSQAVAVGRQYLHAEQGLDSLFAAGEITLESLREGVAEAERLKGRLHEGTHQDQGAHH